MLLVYLRFPTIELSPHGTTAILDRYKALELMQHSPCLLRRHAHTRLQSFEIVPG